MSNAVSIVLTTINLNLSIWTVGLVCSQGTVIKCTATILFLMVDWLLRGLKLPGALPLKKEGSPENLKCADNDSSTVVASIEHWKPPNRTYDFRFYPLNSMPKASSHLKFTLLHATTVKYMYGCAMRKACQMLHAVLHELET